MRTFLTALLATCALMSTAAELRLRGEVTDQVTRLPLGEVPVDDLADERRADDQIAAALLF